MLLLFFNWTENSNYCNKIRSVRKGKGRLKRENKGRETRGKEGMERRREVRGGERKIGKGEDQ